MCFDFFNKPSIQNLVRILSFHPTLTADQLNDSPASAPFQKTGPPPFYALLIGINEYASPNVKDLKGAVPDALAVKKYLEEDLGVPGPQINLLRDAEATRGRIIKEFNNLLADQRIRRGDPILIYYAGHGGEVDAPKGWEASGGKIQMLIPYDFRTTVDGKNITGIPDITIGTLLSRISGKCGDNITVILDCCHSGSGTRGDTPESQSSRMARVTDIPHDVPSDLDLEIWNDTEPENRGAEIAPGFIHHGLRSHILLAACAAKEVAYEDNARGVFTTSLLQTLSAIGAQNVTYTKLFTRLSSLNSQNPQCEGIHRNRILFNAKAHSQGCVLFQVKKDDLNYVMDAGTARGINVGDEFTLHNDPHPSQKSLLGAFVVREARPFDSTLAPLPGTSRLQLHESAFALLTQAGTKQDLWVSVARHEELTHTFEALVKMRDERPGCPRILEVERENAKLGIDLDGEKVVFDILDERVTAFNLRRIPFPVHLDATILHSILDAAAYFHWHLDRTDENHNLQGKVRLEFTKVEQVKGAYYEDLTPRIDAIEPNLNQNGVINLVANDKVMYGMKILNDTAVPLFAALFYFDNSNLSIKSLYQPPFGSQKSDPPLRPKGSITLGYGSAGEVPRIYKLDEGQDVEVGFLKLFLSTEYLDLSDIEQSSPFEMAKSKGGFVSAEGLLTRRSIWDTILVTVVVRKG